MPPPDPTTDYLRSRKLPADVVAGGLAGLVERWAAGVGRLRDVRGLSADDFLRLMDLRQLLEDALAHASVRAHKQATARLFGLDTDAQMLLVPTDKCIRGTKEEVASGWTPERNWWYFAVPAGASTEFLSDLRVGRP